jgi:hypothetical protein
MLYKVRIGEDVYLGSADEVLAFLMRAEGAPAGDAAAYMVAMKARIAEHMDVTGIDTSDAAAFLESLGEQGVVPVETQAEPSRQRVSKEEALGDGPIVLGPDVEPEDVDY